MSSTPRAIHFVQFISSGKPLRSSAAYVHSFIFYRVRLVFSFWNRHDNNRKIANLNLVNGNIKWRIAIASKYLRYRVLWFVQSASHDFAIIRNSDENSSAATIGKSGCPQ